ncbi:unnamed protein product [Bathycoccus prasinos]
MSRTKFDLRESMMEEENNNSERKRKKKLKKKKTCCDDDENIDDRGFKKKKKSSPNPPPPIFAFKEQLSCKSNKKCEACVRKVEKMRRECCSDGEDDVKKSSSSKIVLKRPEECERFKRYHHHHHQEEEDKKQSVVGLYAKGDRILTVGDGDLTFSLSLAKRLKKVKLIATTHETRGSLEKAYGKDAIKATLDELAVCGEDVLVLHGVDAAKLEESLMDAAAVAASNKRDVLERVEKCIDEGFDKIVWNFPCVSREEDTGEAKDGAREGADGRNPADVELNRKLTLTFIANAAVMLRKKKSKKKRGAVEVHVTHKVGMHPSSWNVPELKTTTTTSSSSRPRGVIRAIASVFFDRMVYLPYKPRKALVAKSFSIADAKTFIFCVFEEEEEEEEEFSLNAWMRQRKDVLEKLTP